MSNNNIELIQKSQSKRHCEGESRSNLYVVILMRLLRYTRNDDCQFFGRTQYIKNFITFDLVSKNMRAIPVNIVNLLNSKRIFHSFR